MQLEILLKYGVAIFTIFFAVGGRKLIKIMNPFSFYFTNYCYAQELEVSYPKIGGLDLHSLLKITPFEYTQYIYYFALGTIGIFALVSLIWASWQYLISAGDPSTQRSAKERIIASFLAILILAFTFLILRTIKLEFVVLEGTSLPTTTGTFVNVPPPTTSDPLDNIKRVANELRTQLDELRGNVNKFRDLLANCTCQAPTLKAECICESGSLACVSKGCSGDPCPQRNEIRDLKVSLKLNVENLQTTVKVLESLVNQLTPNLILGRQPANNTEKTKIENKINQLKDKVKDLTKEINKIKQAIDEVIPLADECLLEPDACEGECGNTTCHDQYGCNPNGCHPKNKNELCPMDEIDNIINNKFNSAANQIYSIINSILGFSF